MKRILFISHEASRTGAPMVLYHLMRWFRQHHPDVYSTLVLLKGGPMADAFSREARSTMSLPDERTRYRRSPAYFTQRLQSFVGIGTGPDSSFMKRFRQQVASGNHDIIYANTVISIPEAIAFRDAMGGNTLLVAHIHELNAMIDMALPEFDSVSGQVNLFIAASEPVKEVLTRQRGIPAGRVHVVHECAVVPSVLNRSDPARETNSQMVVGGAGAVQYRKGFDVFIETARHIRRMDPQVRILFRWVGEVPDALASLIRGDLECSGLSDMVTFTGEHDDPSGAFNDFDVFLLPSREDPFPLVCIETGMLGIPVVCFDKDNGIAHFALQGGGKVVPYGDAIAMAEALLQLYRDPVERKRMGATNRDVFSQFTPERQCPLIFDLLERQGGVPFGGK